MSLSPETYVSVAIVGGTASVLGGGKFANGAVSAAFVHMYNHRTHEDGSNDNKNYRLMKSGESKYLDSLNSAKANADTSISGAFRTIGSIALTVFGTIIGEPALSWGSWGTSFGIDSYNAYDQDDPEQLMPSIGNNPYFPGGKTGAILGGGAMIYNEVKE